MREQARVRAELEQQLRPLRTSEAWVTLGRSLQGAKQKVMEAHVRALMRGDATLNQRQLDYDRGYWDGVENTLKAPLAALTELEKKLVQLERMGRATDTIQGGDPTV